MRPIVLLTKMQKIGDKNYSPKTCTRYVFSHLRTYPMPIFEYFSSIMVYRWLHDCSSPSCKIVSDTFPHATFSATAPSRLTFRLFANWTIFFPSGVQCHTQSFWDIFSAFICATCESIGSTMRRDFCRLARKRLIEVTTVDSTFCLSLLRVRIFSGLKRETVFHTSPFVIGMLKYAYQLDETVSSLYVHSWVNDTFA